MYTASAVKEDETHEKHQYFISQINMTNRTVWHMYIYIFSLYAIKTALSNFYSLLLTCLSMMVQIYENIFHENAKHNYKHLPILYVIVLQVFALLPVSTNK